MILFLATHVHRWKLLLAPTESPATLRKYMSRELPKGKAIVDIFSDFMRYLFDSTMELFISSDRNGRDRWDSVSDHVELVLTHSNGWGGPQQQYLRTAVTRANIVPATPEGHARIHFVTEGKAILNFCVAHARAGEDLKVRRRYRLYCFT